MENQKVESLCLHELLAIVIFRINNTNGLEFCSDEQILSLLNTIHGQRPSEFETFYLLKDKELMDSIKQEKELGVSHCVSSIGF